MARACRAFSAWSSQASESADVHAPELRALLESVAGRRYDEAVDELTHALQCAERANRAGADDAVVLAAALHDAGRIPAVASLYSGEPHERAGERFVAECAGERAARLVGAHVEAKRYLVATDASYAAALSAASVRSLAVQGGPHSADEARAFAEQPWAADAIALRRWDDDAKTPGAPQLSLDDVIARFERVRAAR